MIKTERLQVTIERNQGPNRLTVARAVDGAEERFFTFGRHLSDRRVNEMVPRLWADSKFKPRKRKEAV